MAKPGARSYGRGRWSWCTTGEDGPAPDPTAPLGEERTVITAEEAGQRLDRWLAQRCAWQSRHFWQQQIAAGQVQVNGQPARASHLIRAGDAISYPILGHPEPPVDPTRTVVYEDASLLVLNKSGNLPCHPCGDFYQHTLWFLLRQQFTPFWIVNRLDRETSGLVLVAKTLAAAQALTAGLAGGQVHKEYLAVVEGTFPAALETTGFLSPPPAGQAAPRRRFVLRDPGDGEPCHTRFVGLATSQGLSLVQCLPTTGRQHQLRATLLALGFPVVGDKLYGVDETAYERFLDRQVTPDDYQTLRLSRQALHAWRLALPPPWQPAGLSHFTAPLPPDLCGLLNAHGLPVPE